MSTVAETEYMGEVVWLGHVAAGGGLRAAPVEILELDLSGDAGARHEGVTRPSCSRVTHLYPKGTEIRNVRQLSILSQEELNIIAAEIGLDRLDPTLLGVSIVLRGIPDFTHVPPGSRLQAPSGLTVTVDMENLPCHLPAREIEVDEPGHGKAFKAAAKGRRGVTAWIERAGSLALGDQLRLFVPQQRAWAP
ncbi:sulfurase [Cribrihabitans sp. XS_ASV171]